MWDRQREGWLELKQLNQQLDKSSQVSETFSEDQERILGLLDSQRGEPPLENVFQCAGQSCDA